jgi:outer membrane protein TolC
MFKKIAIVSLLTVTAHTDMFNFYKVAIQHLKYDKAYSLYEKSNKLSQKGVDYSRYANFSADVSYTKTEVKLLDSGFDTADISVSDTIDIFGKNSYKIEMLHLDLKSKKVELSLQKEELFISLANMIALFHRADEQLFLYKNLFSKQQKIYKKLKLLEQNGGITKLDLLRFKNTLTILELQITSKEQELSKMKEQLKLYAPDEAIPSLANTKILYSKKEFLAHNPHLILNKIDAYKQTIHAKAMYKSYLPTLTTGLAYQKIDDPTANGDNYTFNVAMHVPLNSGDFKEAEALKVIALSQKTKNITYKLQREKEYIKHHLDYQNAKKQLLILENTLNDYQKNQKSIKVAYLKRYVDFNTYIQVLTQSIGVKEQIINLKYKRDLEATILNGVSSGRIYE